MKQIVTLALVLVCAACAKSGGGTNQKPAADGGTVQENRTALSLFYGNYTTVSQDGEQISATDGDLSCSTSSQIGNSVAAYPKSGDTEGATYAMSEYTDPQTNAVVKSDDIWIAPGALEYDDGPACKDFQMSLFADRGQWHMGKDFVEYSFQGTLLRDGQEITFDDSLRADRLADGTVQVHMTTNGTDTQFDVTWILQPKP